MAASVPRPQDGLFDPIDRRIELPYPTGLDGFQGHRIYGGAPYLARGDLICFLDEDNWWTKFMLRAWSMCCAKAINGPSPCARLWTRKANSFAWTTANRLANQMALDSLT